MRSLCYTAEHVAPLIKEARRLLSLDPYADLSKVTNYWPGETPGHQYWDYFTNELYVNPKTPAEKRASRTLHYILEQAARNQLWRVEALSRNAEPSLEFEAGFTDQLRELLRLIRKLGRVPFTAVLTRRANEACIRGLGFPLDELKSEFTFQNISSWRVS